MKLISINTEHTVSPDTIAFNFDSPPSILLKKKLPLALKEKDPYLFKHIDFKKEYLIVQTSDVTTITKEHMAIINDEINKINQIEDKNKTDHQNMLTEIAKSTGLKLDTTPIEEKIRPMRQPSPTY